VAGHKAGVCTATTVLAEILLGLLLVLSELHAARVLQHIRTATMDFAVRPNLASLLRHHQFRQQDRLHRVHQQDLQQDLQLGRL
jgi:heme A synthase